MAKQRKSQVLEIVQVFVDAVERVGSDTVFYLLVAFGSFTTLLKGVSAGWIFGIDLILILGWLATKLVNAYVNDRNAERELAKLKAEVGSKLLAKHRNRVFPQQLTLEVSQPQTESDERSNDA